MEITGLSIMRSCGKFVMCTPYTPQQAYPSLKGGIINAVNSIIDYHEKKIVTLQKEIDAHKEIINTVRSAISEHETDEEIDEAGE
jgi:hypothetical protein